MTTAIEQRSALLEQVGKARTALEHVETVEEALRVAAFADSIRYATQQAKAGVELENAATAVKLRAERRAGELLAAMPKRSAGRPADNRFPEGTDSLPPTLADLGVTKKQSVAFQAVAKVDEDVFEEYVAEPKDDRASRAGLLHAGRQAEQHEPVPPPPLPEGVWEVIYADPPWRYESVSTPAKRSVENHYPTMTLEEIAALAPSIPAADDAVLFLWATSPKLADALRIVEAWRFEYRTCAVWVKDRIGMGYYFRQRHELLLVATRGKPGAPPTSARRDSVLEAPRGEHSAKPDAAYEAIELMYPDARRLELFGRHARDGWDSWGHQA